MPAQGKTNASRVTAGDRILIKRLPSGRVAISQTKTGEGVEVARVTGKVSGVPGRARMTYTLETTAGTLEDLAPIQTMWLAPEDPAGVKRAHVEALKEDQDRDHTVAVRSQLRTATTDALADALTDASPSLAALIQEELDFRHLKAYAERHPEPTAEPVRFTGEPEVTAEEALAAIGGCWAGGALTGKALKAYADGDYVLALAITVDQKALQKEGGPDALHPEHADRVAQAEVLKEATQEALDPAPTAEDMADLALALAAEDLEHVADGEEKPEPADPLAVTMDVVTIHRGDRLYEVIRLDGMSALDGLAQVAPCDPEDHRDPHWVGLDLLHVRAPLGSYRTEEVTRRVRQTREVFRVDGRLVKVRTILTDSRRLPQATLAEVPFGPEPAATLRAGEALVVDGRCFRVMDLEGDGKLTLEPARWRARLTPTTV